MIKTLKVLILSLTNMFTWKKNANVIFKEGTQLDKGHFKVVEFTRGRVYQYDHHPFVDGPNIPLEKNT